ncbi:adenylate/guanylate cyclase domain-containing protein [Enterococcus faecium]|nr:adenylate/guanylate cyclase domain-containing protein [Enterococcus faecium]
MGFLYDYKTRKSKVEEILDNTDGVKDVTTFPVDGSFTYTNGYKAWTTALFVDLRKSTELFSNEDEIEISKVIRGFTSEIIEILKQDMSDNILKEIGIRGDCVYSIYSTPTKDDVYKIYYRACVINTYMKMLNKLLNKRKLPQIRAGIGISTGKTLAVKAGRKSSGINNLVWIGKTVAEASKLADKGNKDDFGPIVISNIHYNNIIDKQKEKNPQAPTWWTNHNGFYSANIIISDFNQWIDDGMKD